MKPSRGKSCQSQGCKEANKERPLGLKKRSFRTSLKLKILNYYGDNKALLSLSQFASHFDINPETAKNSGIVEKRSMRILTRGTRYPRPIFLSSKKIIGICEASPVSSNTSHCPCHFRKGWAVVHQVRNTCRKIQAQQRMAREILRRSKTSPNVRLYAKSGSVDKDEVSYGMIHISKRLQKYPANRIYNQEETGFFYKLLLNITYFAHGELSKEAGGIWAMRFKNRIRLTVSANAIGTHTLPPFFIGKSKKSHCWGLASKSDLHRLCKCYASQNSAWMDTETFNTYLKFWHSNVRNVTSDDACLVLRNCSADGETILSFRGVEFIFLSPNVTSVYQPLGKGVLIALRN